MPAGGASSSGGGGGAAGGTSGGGGGTRTRETKTKGVSKGATKYQQEQANKAPSGRAQKVIDKKSAAKERQEARRSSSVLEAKARWLAEKAKNKGRRSAKGVANL